MPIIMIDPNASSPYDLPRFVKAQDPASPGELDLSGLEDLASDPPTASPDTIDDPSSDTVSDLGTGDDDSAEETTEKSMVESIEKSPAAEWQKYLQPILRDIKNTVMVPVQLNNSYMVPYAKDPDLGFYITGEIKFLDEVPEEYSELPEGSNVKYVAYVSPDGILSRNVDIIIPFQKEKSHPDYHPGNPNIYK